MFNSLHFSGLKLKLMCLGVCLFLNRSLWVFFGFVLFIAGGRKNSW